MKPPKINFRTFSKGSFFWYYAGRYQQNLKVTEVKKILLIRNKTLKETGILILTFFYKYLPEFIYVCYGHIEETFASTMFAVNYGNFFQIHTYVCKYFIFWSYFKHFSLFCLSKHWNILFEQICFLKLFVVVHFCYFYWIWNLFNTQPPGRTRPSINVLTFIAQKVKLMLMYTAFARRCHLCCNYC